MFDWIADPNAWIALATLTTLEIVLGIDNIIFISILTGRLPEHQQPRGRTIGLGLAMGMRILLLLSISWVMGLTSVLFDVADLLPFLADLQPVGEASGDLTPPRHHLLVLEVHSRCLARDYDVAVVDSLLRNSNTTTEGG